MNKVSTPSEYLIKIYNNYESKLVMHFDEIRQFE